MKRCMTMAAALFVAMSYGSALDLSRTCIVRAKSENPPAKVAADDLSKHLELITGKIPEEGHGAAAKATAVFVFTPPRDGERPEKFSSFARREGNVVRFWGDDTSTRGYPHYGSGFAVAEFLRSVLGVRWVRPGDDGIVFERRNTCEFPDDWSYSRTYPYYVSVMRRVDDIWGMRMGYSAKRPYTIGHAFTDWQTKYLKTHPEYFGLDKEGHRGVDGFRAKTAKLCLSNDGCIDQIIVNWTAAGTNRFLNICPNDGTPGYCHCAQCMVLDTRKPEENFYSHLTDRYLNFWNRVTARAVAIRADVQVLAYIYSYYRHPPRRERIEFPDNMQFGIVPSGLDDYRSDLAQWKAAGLKEGRFFVRPNFMAYSGKVPRGYERELYDSLKFYMESGAYGFDYDGGWAPVMAFEYYTVMRLMFAPEMMFEEIEDEYCAQYETCASVAKAYFARIRKRGEAARAAHRFRMRAEKKDVLDDSLLAHVALEGHTAVDLRADVALLDSADDTKLSSAAQRRWRQFKNEAKNYEKVFHEALEKHRNQKKPVPEGWREDFEEGKTGFWKLRDLIGTCKKGDAASGDYSVQVTTLENSAIALWMATVPVVQNGKYRIGYSVKAEEGVGETGIRVAAGKTIKAEYRKRKAGVWHRDSLEFTVPEGRKSVTLYFNVGKGLPGQLLQIDDISLELLK